MSENCRACQSAADCYGKYVAMKKLLKKFYTVLLAVSFVAATVGFFLFATTKECLTESDISPDIQFSIGKRQLNGDSWTSYVPAIASARPGKGNLTGRVYIGAVKNLNRRSIKDWNLEMVITKSCYLNNAWNGLVEIYKGGSEKPAQPLINLKNAKESDFSIQVIKNLNNILIPLVPGDKIVFYPNIEKFIPGKVKDVNSVSIGFVFYTEDADSVMKFDSWKVNYRFEKDLLYRPFFYVFVLLYITWFCLVISRIRLQSIKLAKERDSEHDRLVVEQVIKAFTKFIDAKDIYTGGHSERVAKYSYMLAKEMGKTDEEAQNAYYCGLFHDCGKIAIPDEIIRKPEKLTDEEYRIMQGHTTTGYNLLKELTLIPDACLAALYHHERMDGTGYPKGLKGNEIPEVVRIISVADVFDCMSQDRCYRKAFPLEKIMEEFKNNSGKQFDPSVVNAFLSLVEKHGL